jgi:hypothetical protein
LTAGLAAINLCREPAEAAIEFLIRAVPCGHETAAIGAFPGGQNAPIDPW